MLQVINCSSQFLFGCCIQNVRNYKNYFLNLFEFLDAKPQIVVKVNEIYASCLEGICGYTILDNNLLPFLDSFSLKGFGLEIFINNSRECPIANYSISFAESPCIINNYSFISANKRTFLSCEIEKNQDSSLKLVAGYQLPIIHINGIGYLPTKNATLPIFVNLSLNSTEPNQVFTKNSIDFSLI